jgi:hypothetical protein
VSLDLSLAHLTAAQKLHKGMEMYKGYGYNMDASELAEPQQNKKASLLETAMLELEKQNMNGNPSNELNINYVLGFDPLHLQGER